MPLCLFPSPLIISHSPIFLYPGIIFKETRYPACGIHKGTRLKKISISLKLTFQGRDREQHINQANHLVCHNVQHIWLVSPLQTRNESQKRANNLHKTYLTETPPLWLFDWSLYSSTLLHSTTYAKQRLLEKELSERKWFQRAGLPVPLNFCFPSFLFLPRTWHHHAQLPI